MPELKEHVIFYDNLAKKNINGIQIYKYIYIYHILIIYFYFFTKERERYTWIFNSDIHWLQVSDQGRFWFDFCPVSWNLSISFRIKIKWPFQEKTYHFMFSFLNHVESARAFPPFSRVFPPFSRKFPPSKIDIFLRKEGQISPRGRKYKIDHNGQKMTISRSFTRNPP